MNQATSIAWRKFEVDIDLPFFEEIIAESEDWQQEECETDKLSAYLTHYKMYNGEWRVWSSKQNVIGISYQVEWSPSNEKPWIGTILIHPRFQLQGYAKAIISQIGEEFNQLGHKAMFAACPATTYTWLTFLGRCGFEQFKLEKDDISQKEYIITVKPL